MSWLAPSGFSRVLGSADPVPLLQRNCDLAAAFFGVTGLATLLGLGSAEGLPALRDNFAALAAAASVPVLDVTTAADAEVTAQANLELLNSRLAALGNAIYYAAADPGAVANGTFWIDLSTASPHAIKRRVSGAWSSVGTVREPATSPVGQTLDQLALLPGQFLRAPAGGGAPVAGYIAVGDLPTSGVIAGTYGSATQVPVFSVDAKGRVTGVTLLTITGGGGGGASPAGALAHFLSGNAV